MAAYAAVISLKHTINGLLNSSRISSIKNFLRLAHSQTESLKQVLERVKDGSSERLDGLEGQIRDRAHKLEDVLEFCELNSQVEKYEDEEVREEITSFLETAKKMEEDYIEELSKPVVPQNDNDDATIVPSNIDFGVEMIGHSSQFNAIRGCMLRGMRPDELYFLSLFGEVGSGRTIIAKTILDEYVRKGGKQVFDCGAWVEIGTKHEFKEVLLCILAQILAADDYESVISREDEEVRKYLIKTLEHRRYMIVLDDVRDVKVVIYLRKSLPDQSNGSIVVVTNSLEEVAPLVDKEVILSMTNDQPLDETVWLMQKRMVFWWRADLPRS